MKNRTKNFEIIYSTTESLKEAKRIAKTLVEEKLVACVNIFKINSIYKWKGKIFDTYEYAMIIKTKKKLLDAAMKRIKELHSYETPCIISFRISKGDRKFLEWIEKETKE